MFKFKQKPHTTNHEAQPVIPNTADLKSMDAQSDEAFNRLFPTEIAEPVTTSELTGMSGTERQHRINRRHMAEYMVQTETGHAPHSPDGWQASSRVAAQLHQTEQLLQGEQSKH